ncbi:36107_t:CDS:2, partial [Racocetra persica]
VFVGAILEPKWEELLIWTTWFTILGFLRIFSMLCRDRFEHLALTPNTPVQDHLRILSLLILILISDIFWFIMCISIFRSMLLLLTFECFTLFLDTVQTLVKYVIHLRDLSRTGVWESRGLLLYYTEFVTDTLILVATLGHYLHIMFVSNLSTTIVKRRSDKTKPNTDGSSISLNSDGPSVVLQCTNDPAFNFWQCNI